MENEDNQQVAEQTLEADASLEAGFNRTRSDEPPVETPSPSAEPNASEASTEVQPVAATEPAKAEPAVEEPMIAGFKESEFKTLLAKAQRVDELEAQIKGGQDKVMGKFGEVQRLISELKAAPAGQSVNLSGKLKRLTENFPELAEMLAEDLSELALGSPAQNTADFSEIEKKFDQRLEETNRQYEQKLLTMKHRDWKTTVKSEDFVLWKGTLPAEERQQIETTWDASLLSDKLDAFKEWKAKPPTKQRNDKRLEAAVTPSGTPHTAPGVLPDNAGLNAGFSKVRKKA